MASSEIESSKPEPSPTEIELFERLYRDYQRSVFSFFAGRRFPREECRDLTHEVYVRVFQSMGQLSTPEKAPSWLFTIAANVGRNRLRYWQSAKRGAQLESLDEKLEGGLEPRVDGRDGDPEKRVRDQQRNNQLERAVEELPPRMGQCVRMVLRGLEPVEIANELKVSPNTVKSHLSQAKEPLRKALRRHFRGLAD